MPSTRPLALGAGLLALVGLQGVAAAQAPEQSLGLGARIAIRFGVSLLIALVLGGALVGLSPGYADRMIGRIDRDAGAAFGWGLLAGIGVPIVLGLLAATIVGLVVAIPGALVLTVAGIVGTGVTVVWLGSAVADEQVGGRAVGAGAVVYAALYAIPVLGNLLTSLVGFLGLGVVSRDLWRSYRGDDRRPVDRQSDPGQDRGGGHEVEGGRAP